MNTKHFAIFFLCCLFASNLFSQFSNPHLPLKISENGRYLQTNDGKAFFWMGDTAWEIFHGLDKSETDFYLETRANQGFNVIQVALLPEAARMNIPNRMGELILNDGNLDKPNEKYFEFVDYVIKKAADLGLFVALMPSWGEAWSGKTHLFNPENALRFGNYLGSRYRNQWNIIWLLGGDTNPTQEEHFSIIRSLVKGIKQGDRGSHLCSYHPAGDCSSASFFHNDDWLDFNMTQTGHSSRKLPNYLYVLNNYSMFPVKPCLDGEPRYEDLPIRFWEMKLDDSYKNQAYEVDDSLTPYGYFNDYDVRTAAYWSVFSGACGHTYGNGSIWCFWEKGKYAPLAVKLSWKDAIHSPGGEQMRHLRHLVELFGIDNLYPDRNVITNNSFADENYLAALREKDGSAVLVYSPSGNKFKVSLSKLEGKMVFARWFDPRNGSITQKTQVEKLNLTCEFVPPSNSTDWVLVLENK